jgi:hypothetical protein
VDWFDRGGNVESVLGHMPRGGCVPGRSLADCHSGLKRLPCLLYFRVLLVQPYDTMGSVLIELVVRVQPVGVLT